MDSNGEPCYPERSRLVEEAMEAIPSSSRGQDNSTIIGGSSESSDLQEASADGSEEEEPLFGGPSQQPQQTGVLTSALDAIRREFNSVSAGTGNDRAHVLFTLNRRQAIPRFTRPSRENQDPASTSATRLNPESAPFIPGGASNVYQTSETRVYQSQREVFSPNTATTQSFINGGGPAGGSVFDRERRSKTVPKIERSSVQVIKHTLHKKGAVSAILYKHDVPGPGASDVWPDMSHANRAPPHYYRVSSFRHMALQNDYREQSKKFSKWDVPANKSESRQIPSHSTIIWPPGRVPTEIFELIAEGLSRNDIKSMRLTCREFDRHISQVLFKTVVVPFNQGIYGMLDDDLSLKHKGKQKVGEAPKPLWWANSNKDEMYSGHGIDVFRGFGRHILRFGMSFEVNEETFMNIPKKVTMNNHTSFWGDYEWPPDEYRRFCDVAGIESTADRTPRMKIAFSELTKVQELALSIDAGLGWLSGPDQSIRSLILHQPPRVFGSRRGVVDRPIQAQQELWDYVESGYQAAESDVKVATLYKIPIARLTKEQEKELILDKSQPCLPFLNPRIIDAALPHSMMSACFSPGEEHRDDPETSADGVLFSSIVAPVAYEHQGSRLLPSKLTTAQKEWLLEIGWAQRAFLSSYMLAVIDNPTIFAKVHTLNFARIADRYLAHVSRRDFWVALPALNNVTIKVIPSWREVEKNEAEIVDMVRLTPSSCLNPFYDLLNTLSVRKSIKKLTLGYAAGGEHAEGLFARNNHVLPAPILREELSFRPDGEPAKEHFLLFPYVEQLTLENCWVEPHILTKFTKHHAGHCLKTLRLNSVSLSPIPRIRGHNLPPVSPPTPTVMLSRQLETLQTQMRRAEKQPNLQQIQQILMHQEQALQHMLTNEVLQAHPQWMPLHYTAATLQTTTHIAPGNIINQLPAIPLLMPFRAGSWPWVIDQISPGYNLTHFGSTHSRAVPNLKTNLETIDFESCGYVRLKGASFDQDEIIIRQGTPSAARDFFYNRAEMLKEVMLDSSNMLLGHITSAMPADEMAILQTGWFMRFGWEDREKARAAEFDNCPPGGTGRFAGVCSAGDQVE
ncbi:hypothetical protein GQ43DRAFT_430185 [Delitschia confertaspora ATCC 74209]|uniref:F-box domain-containing protein n=1 Tax=Delitschia confertaspora ATCC 74209 TaxID=1513339 RepID=A0A9P4JPA1_9PLEO|nr:hypothetical protein GQ43DRAFT_430185 [Delitschia confertaspora ATCC 74209]